MKTLKKVVVAVFAIYISAIAVNRLVLYKPDVYDCSDMVQNQQKIFTTLGIKAEIIKAYDETTRWEYLLTAHDEDRKEWEKYASRDGTRILQNNDIYIQKHYYTNKHWWLQLTVAGITIEWESTLLLPVSPQWLHTYDTIIE